MDNTTPPSAGTSIAGPWDAVPHPVLVIDHSGTVSAMSPTAGALFPALAPGTPVDGNAPTWLAAACREQSPLASAQEPVTGPAPGASDGRDLSAHPTLLPGGDVAWWFLTDTHRSLQLAEDALQRERKHAAFLDEASAVLTVSLNVDRCMEATARMAARHLADAAVVVGPHTGRVLPVFCAGADGAVQRRDIAADPADVAGLSEALRGFPPVPSRWIDPATVPQWMIPDDFVGHVGSVVITPLPGHGIPAGALVLLRRTTHCAFSDGEEVLARLFAARAGTALSSARLYAEQSAITTTLLRELLPPQLHRMHGFELAGRYRASEDHQLVGGDFYDVHPAATADEETLVVLGDVCGKGLEAAVLTGKIRNTLQALAPLAEHHEDVLKLLNNALLSPDNSRFATVVLASITHRDGQLRLRLTCAGHPPPLIARADGTIETADTRGMLIGALPTFRARTFDTWLAPGETCLLYTDGITEARGGPLGTDLFGEERLASAFKQCAGLPAEAVVERIMMLTSQWVDRRPHDDIAAVAITAPRRNHLSAVDGHTAGRYTA
ncbi:PP2C family protein-serine/threonine phosphatase [Mycolicibacterium sp. ELW1]|uniref:PP2C family protein-serine/threonine phosphatase n=1 Tax=Mycobacteriaceae TaxID=1762 RepID=UPI0011EF3D7B|nr:GAF domain-containing SpoIIE family protein phosphatase [Mycobacterium sp. ELW1]QEN12132.1 serine/threonine protein phosphatase [Mycobacterium sp. ELW1]